MYDYFMKKDELKHKLLQMLILGYEGEETIFLGRTCEFYMHTEDTTLSNYYTQNGNDVANKVMKKMINSIQDLQIYDNKGPSVEKVIGIKCDYRMLYVQHNYVFYKTTKNV